MMLTRGAILLTISGCGRAGFAIVGADADPAHDATDDLGYCASLTTPPRLCADFDTGSPLVTGFDEINRSPADATTSASLDSLAYSGSSSARMTLTGAGDCSYARVLKDFPTSGDGLRLRFRFRPSQPWPIDHIFANVRIGGASDGCTLLPRLRGGGVDAALHVQWGMPEQNEYLMWTVTPALDSWSQFELAITSPVGVPQVEVFVDDTPALVAGLPQCSFGTNTLVGVGFYCASGNSEARYDDITVDFP